MIIAFAQVNLLVGDIAANAEKIAGFAARARDEHGASLAIFPELAVTGYPPEDLLLRPGLYRQVARALQRIAHAAAGIDIVVGHPDSDNGAIYNSCSWFRGGDVVAGYRKRILPNYGVFDEKRYFSPGEAVRIVDFGGIPVSMSICEDLWTPQHALESARAGAAMLLNINASPFHFEKLEERMALIRRRAGETGMAILYGNLVGGQDELVFDGGSMAADGEGEFAMIAPQFEEGLFLVEAGFDTGRVRLSGGSGLAARPSHADAAWRALVLGIADYVRKNRFNGVVIGLSGGIDSAVTLCLAVDALGAGRVNALLMPSRYTSDISITDARELADRLGVSHHTVSIEPPFTAFREILQPLFAGLPEDATEENIQARCRGVLLMAISNKTGRLVLTTGNKSEVAVGYATLYGDMAGGFAPLKDASKTLVFDLARHRNRDREIIPWRTIERPPSAELRADQKDEDFLPPYEMLDRILERYVERDQAPEEIIDAGFDPATVRRVVELVDRNEYKRRQAAPGIKISKRAFGRDRRYPITSAYRE
jgi:NAD+ synthase (glutamine-hydrolysing)